MHYSKHASLKIPKGLRTWLDWLKASTGIWKEGSKFCFFVFFNLMKQKKKTNAFKDQCSNPSFFLS